MDFKVLDVFVQGGHLVVKAQHFKLDGTAWFTEHYLFQGREGLKHKRATNGLGQPLLDDGTVAPTELKRDNNRQVPVLPTGRQWARRPEPHLAEDSILHTIRLIHRQRTALNSPNTVDSLVVPPATKADNDGCAALLTKFQGLNGREV